MDVIKFTYTLPYEGWGGVVFLKNSFEFRYLNFLISAFFLFQNDFIAKKKGSLNKK